MEWDFRKRRPYSGYERFDFRHTYAQPAATATTGPPSASRRCARACASSGSASKTCLPGRTRQARPLAAPPLKERTMRDIETLIHHFLEVSWGPVVPPGEATAGTEGTEGQQQLLPGERRRNRLVQDAHQDAVVRPSAEQCRSCAGGDDIGPRSDTGEPGLCNGRLRPLTC